MSDAVSLSLDEVHTLSLKSLRANGCDHENATAIADQTVQAEANLCQTHGLFRIPWYVNGLKSGRVDGTARPKVEQLAPAVLRVDGAGGYAPLGLQTGRGPLAACARQNGIAALAFVNMFHVGALWPEVEALAEDGLCVFSFTPSYPYVAPAGGIKPLYGTNPMAFGWPRKDKSPLVFDQASAAMARGEIQVAARDGHDVPETAGVGPNGEKTTDPNVVLEGAQLAFGGHKGASLALMVELLAGALIGEFLSIEAAEDDGGNGGPPKGGELMIAMDPTRFGDPDGFLAHGEKLFAAILEQEETRLPSERRAAARQTTPSTGIKVPRSLHDTITGYF